MYNYSGLKRKVEEAIQDLPYNTEADNLIEPVKYILSAGGKMLRPVMALMACNIFSDDIDDAIRPATGLEIFHNFTLIHDDIMDQAPIRRKLPTVHKKWNTNQAILSGDVMAFIANQCILQSPPDYLKKVSEVYNNAAVEVCVGQQLDMDFEFMDIITLQQYIRMIELKTASLLAASVKIGAIIGGAPEDDYEMLYQFGKNLGIAFQLQDDMLDVWGDSKKFGKKPGGDIMANKKTYPLVKAMEIASVKQLQKLQSLYSSRSVDPDTKVAEVIDIYNELNIREYTENAASDYISEAFSRLEKVKVAEERKKELILTTSSLIGREH